MNLRINISVLLISTLIVFYSCQGDKPVKEKKRFRTEKESENKKDNTITEEESTDPNLYEISPDQFEKYSMKLKNVKSGNRVGP